MQVCAKSKTEFSSPQFARLPGQIEITRRVVEPEFHPAPGLPPGQFTRPAQIQVRGPTGDSAPLLRRGVCGWHGRRGIGGGSCRRRGRIGLLAAGQKRRARDAQCNHAHCDYVKYDFHK